MSAVNKKGPVFDPGLCRCCGTMKKCRVLNVEYESFGKKEVYSDMMMDCFGLLLSHLESKVTDRLICATCVTRLREAFTFKKQVLQCEEAFLEMRMMDCSDSMTPQLPNTDEIQYNYDIIKKEPSEPDDVRDISDGDDRMNHHIEDNVEESKPEINKPQIGSTMDTQQNLSDLDDDLPLQCLAKKSKMVFKVNKMHSFWMKQHVASKSTKPSITKVQQQIREKDHSYMIDSNILLIIENSYAVPFKCRHNNLICYYCGIIFINPKLLRDHTYLKHNPKKFKLIDHRNMIKLDLARIDCRICNQKIDNLDEFKKHIVEKHGKKYYFECKDMVLPFKLDFDEFKCAVCFLCFPYFHALNKHMNEHFSNYICETCGLGFVDINRFLTHQSRHEEGNYPCETCGKLFKSVTNRELHIDRVHKRRGRVYCPKCDVVLMSHAQKMKHLIDVHGEQPILLPCSACQKVFETRRTLTIHWRKEHLKDYRYECHTCGQKFFTSFALKNHMPTHTGERNFACKVCHKTYPRLKTLKEHMRIHTNDRRYRCHICGQAFIQNCSLKGHMKSQHPEYG